MTCCWSEGLPRTADCTAVGGLSAGETASAGRLLPGSLTKLDCGGRQCATPSPAWSAIADTRASGVSWRAPGVGRTPGRAGNESAVARTPSGSTLRYSPRQLRKIRRGASVRQRCAHFNNSDKPVRASMWWGTGTRETPVDKESGMLRSKCRWMAAVNVLRHGATETPGRSRSGSVR
jgi:hypothetical protein